MERAAERAAERRAAMVELLRRRARVDLLAFMRWVWWAPQEFVVGRHTRAICERLTRAVEEWREGKTTYLLVTVPFRHGKSDIVSRAFPAYFLGRNQDRQPDVIMSGYGFNLVRGFSLRVRKIVQSEGYQALFPGVKPAWGANRVDEWQVEGSAGTVTAQGLGGAVTGKGGHCVAGDTPIITPLGVFRIDTLYQSRYRGLVLSYNHESRRSEWKRVLAALENDREDIIAITTSDGAKVRCTSDHLIYADGRYQEAGCLGGREACFTVEIEQDLRNVRHIQRKRRSTLQRVLHACSDVFKSVADVRVLRKNIHADTGRGGQGSPARMSGCVLFSRVLSFASRHKEQAQMRKMRGAGGEEEPQVLCGMQGKTVSCKATTSSMRVLRGDIQAKEFNDDILLDGVQEQSSQQTHEGQSEPALHRRNEGIPGCFYENVCINIRTGWGALRGMFGGGKLAGAPHRPRQGQQQAGEPDSSLPFVSCVTPQIRQAYVRSIEPVCAGSMRVYDLQVEGNGNFFANGILVHNCIIIDDYCRNRAEAVSKVYRDKVWDSFRNDLMTRLNAPAGIVIVCATPWHVDDVRGRILGEMEKREEFPQFEELNFPACKEGEWEYLFPERFSADWYRAQRATLGVQAAALLDCNPKVEGGNRFCVSNIKIHETLDGWPTGRETRGWDLASSSKDRDKSDPDRTWGVRGHVRAINLGDGLKQHEVWLRSAVACREEAPRRNALIRATALADGPGIVQYVEAFGAYKDAYTQLKAMLMGASVVRASRLPGDKSAKLAALEPAFEAGLVHIYAPGFGKWLDVWLDEFSSFPDGGHDDACDATAVMYHSQMGGSGSTFLI